MTMEEVIADVISGDMKLDWVSLSIIEVILKLYVLRGTTYSVIMTHNISYSNHYNY